MRYFGHPAHFIGAYRCRFSLATLTDSGYVVSTVGDMAPIDDQAGPPQEIGYGRLYETMVFKHTGDFHECGCPRWHGPELVCKSYDTPQDAAAGHEDTVVDWQSR